MRRLLKGTYEHADTFVQRDVNPVGIWRPVRLILHDGLRSAGEPVIKTRMAGSGESADVLVSLAGGARGGPTPVGSIGPYSVASRWGRGREDFEGG